MKRSILSVLILAISLCQLCVEIGAPYKAEAANQRKAVKRALLIGISEYNTSPTNKSFKGLPSVKNDIRAMEILLGSPAYDFKVRKVVDSDATRAGILRAIREHLIESASKGDVSLLYFSGHGSQVQNSLGGEGDGKDETLVPYDVVRPVKKRDDLRDIRDKELNELINEAAEKGVRFTAIIDSCHSGSIAKGEDDVRQLEPAEFDIKEEPKPSQLVSPSENGSLIYSAAREFQRASSAPYGSHEVFRKLGFNETDTIGNFTAHLLMVLYENPSYAVSAETLFRRVEGRMRAKGIRQRPEIEGGRERRSKTLFGLEPAVKQSLLPIEKGDDGHYYLLGGLSNGLSAGNDLVRDPKSDKGNEDEYVRIRLTKVELTKSRFDVISGHTLADLSEGDLFRQETWGMETGPIISVWPPPSDFTGAQLMEMAREVRSFASNKRLRIADSPLGDDYTHLLSYERESPASVWTLTFPSGEKKRIGKVLTAATLEERLSGSDFEKNDALFIAFPPPKEFEKTLGFSDADPRGAIARSATRAGSTYLLVGRSRTAGEKTLLEYSWILRSAFDEHDPRRTPDPDGIVSALPESTDWVDFEEGEDAVQRLLTFAGRVARISGWLGLQPPPGAEARFPYRLEIRSKEGRPLGDSEPLYEGNEYRVFLVADKEFLEANLGRYELTFFAYLVAIDKNGEAGLLHQRGSEVRIAIDPLDPQAEIEPSTTWHFEIGPPVGTENYVLLVTTSPLPDKSILFSEGVRTDGGKFVGDPLSQLLNRIGDPVGSKLARGELSTPENWYVQTVTRVSKEK
ncbi:MAG: caspase family protein [Acidobacteriota bacterium]|nr:MAG: caspase family protein [Acidobacteriota bacterium]